MITDEMSERLLPAVHDLASEKSTAPRLLVRVARSRSLSAVLRRQLAALGATWRLVGTRAEKADLTIELHHERAVAHDGWLADHIDAVTPLVRESRDARSALAAVTARADRAEREGHRLRIELEEQRSELKALRDETSVARRRVLELGADLAAACAQLDRLRSTKAMGLMSHYWQIRRKVERNSRNS